MRLRATLEDGTQDAHMGTQGREERRLRGSAGGLTEQARWVESGRQKVEQEGTFRASELRGGFREGGRQGQWTVKCGREQGGRIDDWSFLVFKQE